MNIKKLLYIILILLIYSATIASDKIIFETVFNTENYNSMITQDKEGFIWIATTGGIVKYDGYTETLISPSDDGLLSSIVPSIFVDSEGLIWIATFSGLNKYDKSNNSFSDYLYDSNNKNSISSSQFNWAPKLITEDLDGNIWIGTKEGLNKYDKKSGNFTNYYNIPNNFNSLENNNIWVVHADKEGNIWIGTDKGLDKLNIKYNNFTHYSQRYNNLSDGPVYAIEEDRNGNIWVGSKKGGLSRIEKQSHKITNYKHDKDNPNSLANNEIFNIMCDSNNILWLARSYRVPLGIEKFDFSKEEFELFQPDKEKKDSLEGALYLSTFEDNSGTIWLPNNLGQIEKFDNKKALFTSLNQFKSAIAIYKDNSEKIWISTGDNGLYIYDWKNNETFDFKSLKNNTLPEQIITSISEDKNHNIYLGTVSGEIIMLNKDTYSVEKIFTNPYGNWAVRGFQQDNFDSNIFWFVTEGGGLFEFNFSKEKFKQYKATNSSSNSVSSDIIQNLIQDNKRNLWLGSHGGGLIQYDKKKSKFTIYKKEIGNLNSLNGLQVIDIHIDKSDTLWISTDDGGLNKFNYSSGEFKRYGEEDGFTVKSIRSIIEDKYGYLWLSSANGIFKFNPKTEKVENNFTNYDGLSSKQYPILPQTSFIKSDNQIWFSNNNAIDTFYPSDVKKNNFQPPIVLTSLTQNRELLSPDIAVEKIDNITLNWDENHFEFEFAALNYTLSEKSSYRYKLEGVDSEWYYSGNKRFGRYSGLNGGEYTLRIQGTNNDGIWSTHEAKLKVTVVPPYWQTTGFKFLIVLLTLIIGGGIYYLKIITLKKQQEVLEKQVKERTEELSNKHIELMDGIEYAKKIQDILLPDIKEIENEFKDSFLLYKPKGIVSGDFYWFSKQGDSVFIAVVDCTGHGVPGALLATMGDLLLNKHINEYKMTDPGEILEAVNKDIQKILSIDNERSLDGMDLALCRINRKDNLISFSGARNPLLFILKSGEIDKIKGTRKSIGANFKKKKIKFETHKLKLDLIDSIYLFTDGYVDQLSVTNKSFSYKKLEKTINSYKNKPFKTLEHVLKYELDKHMSSQEQTDDITVAGFKL